MSEEPLVTVLLTTYNHEEYITEAINSILNQKCSLRYELLITEDCSTDGTLDIIKQFQLAHPELIKIMANEQNIGLNATYQNAIKSARGDFIAPLSGDDYWIDDNKLEMQVQFLLANKEIAYVHTEYKSFYESDGKILRHRNKGWTSALTRKKGKEALIAMLCHDWTGYPSGITSCFRKEPLLKGISKHSELLNQELPGEGTITHASMTYYGGLYAFIPIETAMYRIRAKSLSHYETDVEQFEFQKKYFLLRMLTAESFNLARRDIKKIQKLGMYILFKTALTLDIINEFESFAKMWACKNEINLFYRAAICLIRLKYAKVCLLILFRFVNKVQIFLRKIINR